MTQSLKILGLLVFAVTCLLSSSVYADTVWISKVSSDSYAVYTGQTVFVKVIVNAGTAPVCITAADSIHFIITDTFNNRYDTLVTATLDTPTLPDTIAINSYDTFIYRLTVLAALLPLKTGALGLQLDASCTAFVIDTVGITVANRRDSDAAANQVDTWVPRTKAVVSFVALALARDTGTTNIAKDTGSLRVANPDTVVLRVGLRNTGQGGAKITIDKTLVTISNGAGVNVTDSCTVETTTASTYYMAGDTYDTICFIITFPDTTQRRLLGNLTIGLKGAGFTVSDSEMGTALTVTRTADTPTFTTYYPLDTTIAQTIYSCNDSCWLSIPAGKLIDPTEITIIVNPTSSDITAADGALGADARLEGVPNTTHEVKLTRAVPAATLATMMTLNIRYNDAGMQGTEESSIRIFRLAGGSWGSALTDSNTPGTDSNVAQVSIASLSIFRCIIQDPVAGDLSRVRAFPNPFIPYDGDANTGTAYNGAANTGITFLGLTTSANLKIYTLDGILVDEENFFGLGSCQWDAKNSRGQECASGIYFYLITAEGGGTAKGTLCIIR